jgi:hypothetical protein
VFTLLFAFVFTFDEFPEPRTEALPPSPPNLFRLPSVAVALPPCGLFVVLYVFDVPHEPFPLQLTPLPSLELLPAKAADESSARAML